MRNGTYIVYSIILFCGFIIAYPFFAFKYFESQIALYYTSKYFLIPIFILVTIVSPILYYKKIRNLKIKPTIKSKIENVFVCILMIISITAVLFGMIFSIIITTNVYFGKSEKVFIKKEVLKYFTNTTKHGRVIHYIEFRDPKENYRVQLEVYREYEKGEIFTKEMYYGYWGIMFSKK